MCGVLGVVVCFRKVNILEEEVFWRNVAVVIPLGIFPEGVKKLVNFCRGGERKVRNNGLKVIIENDMKLWSGMTSEEVVDKDDITAVNG